MIAYVDSSVILRIELEQSGKLPEWGAIDRAITSELTRVECLVALDRTRIDRRLDDITVMTARASILDTLEGIELVRLAPSILDRAAEPFPTSLRALDAIHLATALAARDEIPEIVVASHDRRLGLAARAMGFQVLGVDLAA